MSLIQMSVGGAIMILVTVLFRMILRDHLPKRTFLLLWTIALLRLLVPISIPSAFSLYSWVLNSPTVRNTTSDQSVYSLLPAVNSSVQQPVTSVTHIDQLHIRLIWSFGALLCAIFFAGIYLRAIRRYRMSMPVANGIVTTWLMEHNTHRTIQIRESDHVKSPLTYGVFRPVILLPKNIGWDNQNTIIFALEHEYVHILRYDTLRKLLLVVAVCVHWFNPFVWLMFVLYNRDIELVCDETVLRRIGTDTRKNYANALISMAEQCCCVSQISNYFSSVALEQRIVAIMKGKPHSKLVKVASVILVITVSFCLATTGKVTAFVDATESISGADTQWVWPVESKQVTLSFGEHRHPLTEEIYFADHITIAGTKGESVVSAVTGTVSASGYDTAYGYYAVIDGANLIRTFYGHLQDVYVIDGATVHAGDAIGSVGATGYATGPCLAFAVYANEMAVDPIQYFD